MSDISNILCVNDTKNTVYLDIVSQIKWKTISRSSIYSDWIMVYYGGNKLQGHFLYFEY